MEHLIEMLLDYNVIVSLDSVSGFLLHYEGTLKGIFHHIL